MTIHSERVKLDSELADLDQQLRNIQGRRDLSDGKKILLRAGLEHTRRKKSLEREILEQVSILEPHEAGLDSAGIHRRWAQKPEGLEALTGLGRAKLPWADFTRAEETRIGAKVRLSYLWRKLEELKGQDGDWEAVRTQAETSAQPATNVRSTEDHPSPVDAGSSEHQSPHPAQVSGSESVIWDRTLDPNLTLGEGGHAANEARVHDRVRQAIQLGEWAAGRCEELRKINTFALGKLHSQEAIRGQFPDLRVWGEVIDRFYPALRKKFFDEINARKWNQVDLFEWMAKPWEISGARLYDHYKKYRSANGLGRRRGTARRTTDDERASPTHSKKHS